MSEYFVMNVDRALIVGSYHTHEDALSAVTSAAKAHAGTTYAILQAVHEVRFDHPHPNDKAVENWKPIPGFEGRYEASDWGRIRSVSRRVRLVTASGKVTSRHTRDRILRPGARGIFGHLGVVLCDNAVQKTRSVHSLVMLAFVGPAPKGREIRHLNGIPHDNRLCNLKYGTKSENVGDRLWHGQRKLSATQISEIKHLGKSCVKHGDKTKLAKKYGITGSEVHGILSGKSYPNVV